MGPEEPADILTISLVMEEVSTFLFWTRIGGYLWKVSGGKATPLDSLERSLGQDIQEVGLAWPCACVRVVYSGLGDEIVG